MKTNQIWLVKSTAFIADEGLNIVEMMNKSKGDIAFTTIVDTLREASDYFGRKN